ncbi:hypothetical protein EJ05DRAFT_62964 [Pseudovirgaria hyperparasitica]|uniref:MARVEL domain-containing protein n=1 Tax=Pseudovirgaria hyperparasitica TaxID=470096 RepID=A0A6A6W2J1_9PEZI|nr:uncharacterized protein EJ05DRAFT_62964 [Pseudovirgaria hyperparasitica]KAF2756349.1 hypothetical protein EJ05DRAFT_62964 [Pseudovirgaria hyperparasitica]
MHLPFWVDFLWSGMWFVAFGLLVKYLNDIQVCGAAFTWSDIQDGGFCGKWKADLAFAFVGAMLWLVSCALGYAGYRQVKQQEMSDAVADAEKKATAEAEKKATAEAEKKAKESHKPKHSDTRSMSAAQE